MSDTAQIPDGCAFCGALPCDQVIKPSDIWQPIATAPKSGEVMIYCAQTDEQFVAFWGTDPSDGDQQWVFARSPDVSFIVRDPTHWAPCLPPPPCAKCERSDGDCGEHLPGKADTQATGGAA